MQMRLRSLIVLLAATFVGGICPVAVAQAPDYAAAKKHYTTGQVALSEKRYSDAVREFGAAYEITKDPVLFFKIGEAHDGAGDCAKALPYYERYVKQGKPVGEHLAATEQRIATCKRKVARESSPPPTEPTTEKPPVEKSPDEKQKLVTEKSGGAGSPSAAGSGEAVVDAQPSAFTDQPTSWKRTTAWISVGLTVAFATTGVVMGLSASSREEDIENLVGFRDAAGDPSTYTGTTKTRYDDLVDEGDRFNLLSRVAFGIAGATAITAAIFFVIDSGGGESRPGTVATRRPSLAVTPSRAGVAVNAGWEF